MDDETERREEAINRLKNRRGFWPHLVSYVVVNVFLVLTWALSGGGYFWPAWVMGAWGIGLIMHEWSAFVGKPISEADAQREMRRRGDPSAVDHEAPA